MTMNLATRPASRTLVGLVALSAALLMGCGSDISSRPDLQISEEVIIPETMNPKLALPSHFEARSIMDGVRLVWERPAHGYTAILYCDGLEIATLDARTFNFDHIPMTAPGTYRYSIHFARGGSVSSEVYLDITILPEPVQKDRGERPLQDS